MTEHQEHKHKHNPTTQEKRRKAVFTITNGRLSGYFRNVGLKDIILFLSTLVTAFGSGWHAHLTNTSITELRSQIEECRNEVKVLTAMLGESKRAINQNIEETKK